MSKYLLFLAGGISGFVAFYYYLLGSHIGKDLYLLGSHIGKDLTKTRIFSRVFPFLIKKPSLVDFFRVMRSPNIEYVVFQFGLRPHLPLMDILYLEYLHGLLRDGAIEKLLLFPTIDLSSPRQDQNEYKLLQRNIDKVFKNYKDKILFCEPFITDQQQTPDFTSPEFLKTIEYLGSQEYFAYLWTEWKMNIRDIGDFNRYHPYDKRLVVLFTHIVGAWQVLHYLNRRIIQASNSASRLELGFVLWETEVDKLGVYKRYIDDNPNVRLSTFLGRTILDKYLKPLPAFEPEHSISLFQELSCQFEKINSYSKSMIRKSISVLEVILRENYSFLGQRSSLIADGQRIFEQETKSGHCPRVTLRYRRHAYLLVALLNTLMCLYENKHPLSDCMRGKLA